jgi:hypothetical protein
VVLGKIKVETDNTTPLVKRWRVYLDNQDITRYVRGLDIHAAVGDVATVDLHLIGALELPGEIHALATAQQDPVGINNGFAVTTNAGDSYVTRVELS